MTTMLRLGTRGSALALAQSGGIAATIIAELGTQVELVTVQTEGDRNPAAIAQIGGTGVFVTALRDALLARQVDLAVHSFKDLPTAPAPGSGRDRRAAPPSCSAWASGSRSSRSAATSTPASARSAPASWTASCWPAPGCSASAGPMRSPRCSTR